MSSDFISGRCILPPNARAFKYDVMFKLALEAVPAITSYSSAFTRKEIIFDFFFVSLTCSSLHSVKNISCPFVIFYATPCRSDVMYRFRLLPIRSQPFTRLL
ncbi:hypothetical protein ERX35_010950 [Macrococcus equipercicus]|uniref:Uncharacterized protein n=1 Tax=Macrococcus equipercicus TaxID=69967 RepID=A0ABQ6R681_9STAP|nr:hypothetical protein ERX35_010950 [Macrococcus equipercicus]